MTNKSWGSQYIICLRIVPKIAPWFAKRVKRLLNCVPVGAVPRHLPPPDGVPLDPLDLVQVLLEGGGDNVRVEVALGVAVRLDAEDLEVDRLRRRRSCRCCRHALK